MLINKIFFFFYKAIYLNKEVNCTEKEFPLGRLTVTSVWLESVIKGGAVIDLVSPNVINFFSSSRRLWIHKPEFVHVGHFLPSLLFASKFRANPALVSLHTKFQLLALVANNRQRGGNTSLFDRCVGDEEKVS
jgi:hypothetical protein